MTTRSNDDEIRVYWQPGCTSCLRTKEMLTRYGIPFVSRNVLADEEAFAELARFGLRQVPIVTRGDSWANGQIASDVARLVGIDRYNPAMLPVSVLQRRLTAILEGAEGLLAKLPDEHLSGLLPNRPRSHADLAYHIFNVADAFLELQEGIALTYDAYNRLPPANWRGKAPLLAYAGDVRRRLADWFATRAGAVDWNAAADVYYGQQTLHQYLERTTWHAGQHTRQLKWVLDRLGVPVEERLGPEVFDGLPMPRKVWDDEVGST